MGKETPNIISTPAGKPGVGMRKEIPFLVGGSTVDLITSVGKKPDVDNTTLPMAGKSTVELDYSGSVKSDANHTTLSRPRHRLLSALLLIKKQEDLDGEHTMDFYNNFLITRENGLQDTSAEAHERIFREWCAFLSDSEQFRSQEDVFFLLKSGVWCHQPRRLTAALGEYVKFLFEKKGKREEQVTSRISMLGGNWTTMGYRDFWVAAASPSDLDRWRKYCERSPEEKRAYLDACIAKEKLPLTTDMLMTARSKMWFDFLIASPPWDANTYDTQRLDNMRYVALAIGFEAGNRGHNIVLTKAKSNDTSLKLKDVIIAVGEGAASLRYKGIMIREFVTSKGREGLENVTLLSLRYVTTKMRQPMTITIATDRTTAERQLVHDVCVFVAISGSNDDDPLCSVTRRLGNRISATRKCMSSGMLRETVQECARLSGFGDYLNHYSNKSVRIGNQTVMANSDGAKRVAKALSSGKGENTDVVNGRRISNWAEGSTVPDKYYDYLMKPTGGPFSMHDGLGESVTERVRKEAGQRYAKLVTSEKKADSSERNISTVCFTCGIGMPQTPCETCHKVLFCGNICRDTGEGKHREDCVGPVIIEEEAPPSGQPGSKTRRGLIQPPTIKEHSSKCEESSQLAAQESRDDVKGIGVSTIPQFENEEFFGAAQEGIFSNWLDNHIMVTCKGKTGAAPLRNAYAASIKKFPWIVLRSLSNNIRLCDPSTTSGQDRNWGYFILRLDSRLLNRISMTPVEDPKKKKRLKRDETPITLGSRLCDFKRNGVNWALMRISPPISREGSSRESVYAIIEIVAHKVTKEDLKLYRIFEDEETVVVRPLETLEFKVSGVRASDIPHLVESHGLQWVHENRMNEGMYNEFDIEELVDRYKKNLQAGVYNKGNASELGSNPTVSFTTPRSNQSKYVEKVVLDQDLIGITSPLVDYDEIEEFSPEHPSK
jgi:hypothetical protein